MDFGSEILGQFTSTSVGMSHQFTVLIDSMAYNFGSWAKATGLPVSVMTQAVKDSLATPEPITPAVITSEQSVANAFTAAASLHRSR